MSQFQKPATLPELRQRVFASIDKLSDRATFSQASSELHFIARTLSSDHLASFFAGILSVDASVKSAVRVHCLNLLSLLANTHQSSLSPHIPKTIIPFILRRLRDGDTAVRDACANAVGALSPVGFSSLLPAFLSAVVSEQECNAQIGSCLCLKAAIDAADGVEAADQAELRRVFPRLVKIVRAEGFKAKAALLGLIGSIVGVNGGGVVNGRGGMMGSVIGCAVEMLSCEDWATRKAAAGALETAAEVVEEELGREVMGSVVGSLESRRFDKVKVNREIMNRALEAWKNVAVGPEEEDLPLPLSNTSSFVKDNSSGDGSLPSISRRSSFAATQTQKQIKMMNKTRSSLSDTPIASISSSISASIIGLETHSTNKTMPNSRSSLSEDSTITDSSSISKKPTSKTRSSLPDHIPPNIWKKSITIGNHKRSNSRVVPLVKKEESCGSVINDQAIEGVSENNADNQDLSLIRNQLLQIERQQSYLLDLLQKFMGNSQKGIDSLETRVSDLEQALDEISYDLGVQSGRIQNKDNVVSTCCSSTEFLSPKFWRRPEGRSSISKSLNSGSNKDGNIEALQMDEHRFHEQNREFANKSVKGIDRNGQRGRTCSPRTAPE